MEPAGHLGEVVRFGPFEVDLKERVLRKHGVRLKVQAQPFQVLTALLEVPGTAVTREELRRRIWPDDTFVDFEHGLNAAVTRLRQALGDPAGNARYIQTIPKYGYRFSGEVEGRPVEPRQTEASIPLKPWRRRATLWIALLLLTVTAGSLTVSRNLDRTPPPAGRAVPLTTFPGYEAHPALSPDGTQVAFTWNGEKQDNFDIYVMRIGSETPRRLTSNPAEDIRPAWSPDGRTIAFLRRLTVDRGELLQIRAEGGREHKIREVHNREFIQALGRFASVTWSPDGRWIATSHREPNDACERIYLFSPTGEVRPLTSLPCQGWFAGDQMPTFSSDGKALAINRLTGPSTMNIHVLPLDANYNPTGEARPVTGGSRASFNPVWLPDGRILYITGVWGWGYKIAVTRGYGGPGGDRTLPDIEEPREFAVGRHLVYSRVNTDVNIWRAKIPRDGEPPSAPEPFVNSTRIDDQPKYSPDGENIAFRSLRSGSPEIWVSKADGSDAVRITNIGWGIVGFPRWSPNGSSIVFHARPEGQSDLFVVPAAGGIAKRLTTNPLDDGTPSYSNDGRWIYFTSLRSGQPQVWKMPAAGGEAEAVPLTTIGGYSPFDSRDGKTVFYFSPGHTAIWSVSRDGGRSVKVVDVTHDYPSGFDVTAEGLYYPAGPHSGEQRFIQFFDFTTAKSRPVVLTHRPFGFGMTVSPDSKYVLFGQRDEIGSDLMLIENFSVR